MRKLKVNIVGRGFFVTETVVKSGVTIFGLKVIQGKRSVTVWRNADGCGDVWVDDDGVAPDARKREVLNDAVRQYLKEGMD